MGESAIFSLAFRVPAAAVAELALDESFNSEPVSTAIAGLSLHWVLELIREGVEGAGCALGLRFSQPAFRLDQLRARLPLVRCRLEAGGEWVGQAEGGIDFDEIAKPDLNSYGLVYDMAAPLPRSQHADVLIVEILLEIKAADLDPQWILDRPLDLETSGIATALMDSVRAPPSINAP